MDGWRIAVPPSLARSVPKRRAEFAAGRHCAREALRALGVDSADDPIDIGPHREPLWPKGITGSITHCAGYACAAVARESDILAIGIDSERVVHPSAMTSIEHHIASPAEVERISTQWSGGDDVLRTLVFSAKECLFKCLFPRVRRYWGFLDVEMMDVREGSFEIRLLTTLHPTLPSGRSVTGIHRVVDGRVDTALFLGSDG